MSDSEVQYTVVDELEEGEIIENTPSFTKKQTQAKRKNCKLVVENGICAENKNTRPHKKHKTWHKNNLPKRYRSPVASSPVQGVLTSKQPRSSLKTPQFQVKPSPGNWKKDTSPNLSTKGRNLGVVARRSEPEVKEFCDNSVPQLDLNSSYDDLLKHHKAIQKALSKLEKEQRRTKKNCPHRGKKKKLGGSSEKSVGDEKKNAQKTPITRKKSPKIVSRDINRIGLLSKIEVILDNRVERNSCDEQSSVDVTNSSNITVPVVDSDVCEPVEQDDDLEELRKNVLMSVAPKPSGRTDAVEMGLPSANMIPNTVENSSSAFSVSGCRDDYSVVDMEVDEDSCLTNHIETPSPRNPATVEDSRLSDDDEIATMREKLLQSLNRVGSRRQRSDRKAPTSDDSKSAIFSPTSSVSRSSSQLVADTVPSLTEAALIAGSSRTPRVSPVVVGSRPLVCVVPISITAPQPCVQPPFPNHIKTSASNSVDSSVKGVDQVSFVSRTPVCEDPTSIAIQPPSAQQPRPNHIKTLSNNLVDPSLVSPAAHTGGGCQSAEIRSTSSVGSRSFLEPPSNGLPLTDTKERKAIVEKNCPVSKETSSKQPFAHSSEPAPWVFMKQNPVIIRLGDDSSDSCSSDDEGPEAKISIFDSLEELIRSEKMKTTCRQADPTTSEGALAVETEPGLEQEVGKPSTDSSCRDSRVVIAAAASSTDESSYRPPTEGRLGPKVAPAPPKPDPADLIHEYKLLGRKLSLACDTLQKEEQILAMKKIVANKKKTSFINSQLATQRLKEQLAAAEKVRKTNMRMMFVANAELETVQSSVLKRKVLLKQMNEQHQKLKEQISLNIPFPLDLLLNSL